MHVFWLRCWPLCVVCCSWYLLLLSASVNTSIIVSILIRLASGKGDFIRHFHLYTHLLATAACACDEMVIVVIPCNTGWK